MERLGVVAIVIDDRNRAGDVQSILSAYGDIIVARMGVPDKAHHQSVIALIVRGKVEQISAMTGKLGKIDSVQVKSALTAREEE